MHDQNILMKTDSRVITGASRNWTVD